MSEGMIELLKNVNLSSLRKIESVNDLIKECKRQGAVQELVDLKVKCNDWLNREQSSQGIELDFVYDLIEKRLKELKELEK